MELLSKTRKQEKLGVGSLNVKRKKNLANLDLHSEQNFPLKVKYFIYLIYNLNIFFQIKTIFKYIFSNKTITIFQ